MIIHPMTKHHLLSDVCKHHVLNELEKPFKDFVLDNDSFTSDDIAESLEHDANELIKHLPIQVEFNAYEITKQFINKGV